MSGARLLVARGVTKSFAERRRGWPFGPAPTPIAVLHGVDLAMDHGEVTGLIGESGSGKTTFGKVLLRIVEPSGGTVHLEGEDWCSLDSARVQALRSRYQMIYQNPYACLNPGLTVRQHLLETLAVFRKIRGSEAEDRIHTELGRFGMTDKAASYPGELSGGEKRRISVARTLLTEPRLVVADEPTSGLDASVKADVLDAILAARQARTAYLFISHDLDVIRFVSDRILVMYRGRIVEEMEKDRIDPALPHHPYTRRLFEAARAEIPTEAEARALAAGEQLQAQVTGGCPYRPLCPLAARPGGPDPRCSTTLPALTPLGHHQKIACHVLVEEFGGSESTTLPASALRGPHSQETAP